MSKKIISLLLAVMLTVSMVAVAAVSVSAEEGADATYIVAGSEEVFGSNWGWTDENNLMTDEDGDGIYELVVPEAGPFVNAQFKIGVNGVDGTGSVGPNGDGTIGPDSKFNFQFNIDETCDLTITFNPATNEVTYSGEYISEYVFSVEELRAVGNGGNGWLNDVVWDPAADDNLMEEIEPGVYQIVMIDVEPTSSANLKFAADGSWGINWGAAVKGDLFGMDEPQALTFNGQDMLVVIGEGDDDENLYTVTLTVDLTNFNDATKEGAMVTITQEAQGDEPSTTEPTEATTEATEATTEATEATTEETTTAQGAPLTVNATSNFFSKAEAQYNAETNEVTVSYYLSSDKDILNFQIGTKEVESTVIDGITYDPEVLKVADSWTPKDTLPMTKPAGCVINLRGIAGSIKLNGSNLNLWEVDPETPFVQVKFEVLDLSGKGPVTTTIGCEVESMIIAEVNDNYEVDSATEEYVVRNKMMNEDVATKNNVTATTKLTPDSNYVVETTTEATEASTEATEVSTEATEASTEATEASTEATEVSTEATEESTTETPAGNVITANSNLFPTDTYNAEVGETVTVEYSLDAKVLQTQWMLMYDPEVLELVTASDFMPQLATGADYNTETAGVVEGSAANLALYNVTSDAPFVSAQFKKIAEGDTTVTLVVSVLETAELNADGTVNEDSQTYVVFNGQVSEDITTADNFNTEIKAATVEPGTTEVPTEAPTQAPTEAPTEAPTQAPTEAPTDAPTQAPTEAPTQAPSEVPTQPTTGAGAGSSTSDTPNSSSTSDTPNGSTSGNGTVQTGDASMAIIILSVLVAGTAVMFVLRKREMF